MDVHSMLNFPLTVKIKNNDRYTDTVTEFSSIQLEQYVNKALMVIKIHARL